MRRPHWLGSILYITFMKKKSNYFMHQPLALTKFFFLSFILNNRAGPCFGEGWGKSIMGDGIHDNILF